MQIYHPRTIALQLIVVNGLIIVTARSGATVHLGGDGVGNVGQLLLLLLEVLGRGSGGVLLEPVLRLLDGIENLVCVSVMLHQAY